MLDDYDENANDDDDDYDDEVAGGGGVMMNWQNSCLMLLDVPEKSRMNIRCVDDDSSSLRPDHLGCCSRESRERALADERSRTTMLSSNHCARYRPRTTPIVVDDHTKTTWLAVVGLILNLSLMSGRYLSAYCYLLSNSFADDEDDEPPPQSCSLVLLMSLWLLILRMTMLAVVVEESYLLG